MSCNPRCGKQGNTDEASGRDWMIAAPNNPKFFGKDKIHLQCDGCIIEEIAFWALKDCEEAIKMGRKLIAKKTGR